MNTETIREESVDLNRAAVLIDVQKLPSPKNSVARGYNYFFVITHFVSPFVFCYYARYAAEKYRRRVYKICPAAEN